MKPIGIILFVIGCLAIFVSLHERGCAYNSDVYNNGLLNERTNDVIVSCFVSLIGAIWIALSSDRANKNNDLIAKKLDKLIELEQSKQSIELKNDSRTL